MLAGLPPYRPPSVVDLRCVCDRRYTVFTGEGLSEQAVKVALVLAQEHAGEHGRRFIDARLCPWLTCECGQFLDFLPDSPLTVQ